MYVNDEREKRFVKWLAIGAWCVYVSKMATYTTYTEREFGVNTSVGQWFVWLALTVQALDAGLEVFREKHGQAPSEALVSTRCPGKVVDCLAGRGIRVEHRSMVMELDVWLR